jgi:hypothetical protein
LTLSQASSTRAANSGSAIRAGVERLSRELADAGIQLSLVTGADVHLAPDLTSGFRSGRIPTLAGSRYFLFEPPHRVLPPRLEDVVFNLMAEGYVPILTHPECGVQAMVSIPSATAMRAIASDMAESADPSSKPGNKWQCRSIIEPDLIQHAMGQTAPPF